MKYFVLHLSESDPEWADGFRYEIQVLDGQGRAVAQRCIRKETDTLSIDGYEIPFAVIAAARRQSKGQGEYVDSEGVRYEPF